jgi:hypothetical protein
MLAGPHARWSRTTLPPILKTFSAGPSEEFVSSALVTVTSSCNLSRFAHRASEGLDAGAVCEASDILPAGAGCRDEAVKGTWPARTPHKRPQERAKTSNYPGIVNQLDILTKRELGEMWALLDDYRKGAK